MIQSDQPTIFNNRIIAAMSSRDDGNMKFGHGNNDDTRENIEVFLRQTGIDPLQSTLVPVSYDDTTDFTRYHVIDDDYLGEGMLELGSSLVADALVVTRPDHALFLPLADCAGAVIYDPENRVLMVSHLGRHSVEQQGAAKCVRYLIDHFDTHPRTLQIWLSPMVGGENYPLQAFDGRALREVIIEQLLSAGVAGEHIQASSVDTAESDQYFSHSEYLAGNQLSDERFAIVGMMHE